MLGEIVDNPTGWAVATDAGGDHFFVGGDRLGSDPGPIALSRNRFDGSYDLSFGREGTAIAYYGLQGGSITDLAVDDQRVSALVEPAVYAAPSKIARFKLDPGPADADADGRLDADDRCDFFSSWSPSGCPPVSRSVRLRTGGGELLYAVLASEVEGCEEHERVSVYRRQAGRDQLVRRRRTDRWSTFRVTRDPPPGRYYAVAKRHLKEEAGRCASDRSPVKVVGRP